MLLLLLRPAVSGKGITIEDLWVLGGKLKFLAAMVQLGRSYC